MRMQKIKLLSIGNKKLKLSDKKNWEALLERYVPDLYENFYAVGEKEAIKQVTELQPEIVMLSNDMKDTLELLKNIKQIHPTGAIFVVLGMVDDEQETIDEFKAHGAYKCYTAPLSMDTLTHDMYVALNLE